MFKILILLLIGCALCGTAVAQPSGVHLSWNRNEAVNPSNSVAITWFGNKTDQQVLFGTDSTRLSRTQEAETLFSEGFGTFVSKATLKKLKPATKYFYRVGSQHGWSDIYRFYTAPRPGAKSAFRVGIWSDTQNNGGNYNFEQTDTIVRMMTRQKVNFTLHNGDVVENGSVAKSYVDFFRTSVPLNANNPFMSVTGNHDIVNDPAGNFQQPFPIFHDIFNLPRDQVNYSYTYGNTHFIAINSGYAQGASKLDKDKVLFAPGSDEYKWLEADLAKARKDKKIKWVVLYCHYPFYAYGVSHIPQWQANVTPLIDKYRVDLALAGHRHVYERHAPIRNNVVQPQEDVRSYVKPEGTIYITNGSCGGSLQGIGGSKLPTMIFTPNEKIYTWAIMSIAGNELRYEVYNKDGALVDQFEIKK